MGTNGVTNSWGAWPQGPLQVRWPAWQSLVTQIRHRGCPAVSPPSGHAPSCLAQVREWGRSQNCPDILSQEGGGHDGVSVHPGFRQNLSSLRSSCLGSALILSGLHSASQIAGWPREWGAASLRVTHVALGGGVWALTKNMDVALI